MRKVATIESRVALQRGLAPTSQALDVWSSPSAGVIVEEFGPDGPVLFVTPAGKTPLAHALVTLDRDAARTLGLLLEAFARDGR